MVLGDKKRYLGMILGRFLVFWAYIGLSDPLIGLFRPKKVIYRSFRPFNRSF
jgi:hypothetical protein